MMPSHRPLEGRVEHVANAVAERVDRDMVKVIPAPGNSTSHHGGTNRERRISR
jgi:hypothetical protein